MAHPLDNLHSSYALHYGVPDLLGKKFRFWAASNERPNWQERYLVEFPTDWMKRDETLATWKVMNTLDSIMEWYGLQSIRFVCSRSRSCDTSWPDGRDGCVKLVYQLTGWCDMYEKRLVK